VEPPEDGILEVHGLKFLYDDEEDEVWFWENRDAVWVVLPEIPSYLKVVNGKLSVLELRAKKSKCDCDNFVLFNFGCACGGV